MSIKIGVLGIQGAISEHVNMLNRSFAKLGINGDVISIRKGTDLEHIHGLIIPGGESTTISKLIQKMDIAKKIKELAGEGIPLFGTCAGLILFAKKGDMQTKKTNQKLLNLMDIGIDRNAFGRQRESFETEIWIDFLNSNFHAIFIRAPIIKEVWGNVKIEAKYQDKIVAASQDNLLVTAFHPELSEDTRIHEYFINMI